MGVVYEAEQDSPKRRVALKVIRAGAFASEHQVRLFEREADMLARLKHPGIAEIHQLGETEDGQPYFVMELIQGQSLDRYLAKQPAVTVKEHLETRRKPISPLTVRPIPPCRSYVFVWDASWPAARLSLQPRN